MLSILHATLKNTLGTKRKNIIVITSVKKKYIKESPEKDLIRNTIGIHFSECGTKYIYIKKKNLNLLKIKNLIYNLKFGNIDNYIN